MTYIALIFTLAIAIFNGIATLECYKDFERFEEPCYLLASLFFCVVAIACTIAFVHML